MTKYRKKLLRSDVADDIKQYLYDTCVRYHWYIRRMQADKDHAHILLQYNPSDNISQIVALLEQHSTYHIWKKHSHLLKRHCWKEKTFSSDGYFAASIGQVSQATIERYIESQG